ncbi:hypothetical protein QLL95_gp1147 [Cotonvirus japonicus]|uniref:Uncharacterized protein n=1 Tax=Cotonvirus japonicus TaxID=2811091 RepID=A0ABM7NS96_9VIRU|nr:hypothetical protein QLL95_gp1147 [Cotonvirus japonicus]BCS82976.1 hypothetical protein [Cotonvirus japonicus]
MSDKINNDEPIINLPFNNSYITINIIPLNEIINKTIRDINFQEVISLIFHASFNMTCNVSHPDFNDWNKFYTEFVKDFERQNLSRWPIMTIIDNEYYKRTDVIAIENTFVSSNNILTLLYRLMYIENYKITAGFNNYKLLEHKLHSKFLSKKNVNNISLHKLFKTLKLYVDYYSRKYTNTNNLEYSLATRLSSLIG